MSLLLLDLQRSFKLLMYDLLLKWILWSYIEQSAFYGLMFVSSWHNWIKWTLWVLVFFKLSRQKESEMLHLMSCWFLSISPVRLTLGLRSFLIWSKQSNLMWDILKWLDFQENREGIGCIRTKQLIINALIIHCVLLVILAFAFSFKHEEHLHKCI